MYCMDIIEFSWKCKRIKNLPLIIMKRKEQRQGHTNQLHDRISHFLTSLELYFNASEENIRHDLLLFLMFL